MSNYTSKLLEDLQRLVKAGKHLYYSLAYELKKYSDEDIIKLGLKTNELPKFSMKYESWYSESLLVIKQILPDRLDDFVRMYMDGKRKELDFSTYTIYDALLGVELGRNGITEVDQSAALPKLLIQINILSSVTPVLQSSLNRIKEIVRADFYDSELICAEELLGFGFTRASGAIAGVVLEKHLFETVLKHELSIQKKNPTINDYNEKLKNESIIDIPVWRHIQFLADIRNLCAHGKDREPSNDEVRELIIGVNKIIKTVF